MVDLLYNDKKYTLPEHFNELTGEQLIKLVAVLKAPAPDALLLSLQVLQVLMNKSKAAFYFLSLDLRERALNYVQWVFQKNTLTEQLLPVINGFYGPKSNFDNLTLSEYHCSELFYAEYLHSSDDQVLDKLVAVLYRMPKKNYDVQRDPNGDIRNEFNEHEIDFWAQQISEWSAATKQAILFWYDGCREQLISLYSAVFAPAVVDSSADDSRGMFGVIRGIADGGKYGKFEEVKKLNIHTALLEMEELIKEAAALNNVNA